MLPQAEARLIETPGLGRTELARLRRSTVAVIGLGVLGGQVCRHLGLLGVPQVLIDSDVVAPENLGNQSFALTDIGEAKSKVRAREITACNPDCLVYPVTSRIEALGLGALAGVDLLVTGLDSRASRVRVNEISGRLRIPWIDAAVDGSGRWLLGTVTLHDPRHSDSPCYLCRYDQADMPAIAREGRGPGCPNPLRDAALATPPTLQASAFGALVAACVSLWAVRTLLGCDARPGQQLQIEGDPAARTRLVSLTRNRRCLFDHEPLEPLRAVPGPAVGDLLAAATADFMAVPDELRFHGRSLVTGLVCPSCGVRRDIVRAAETFSDAEILCGCRSGREMAPAGMSDRLPHTEASRVAERTWSALGIPTAEIVTATVAGRAAHYVVNPPAAAPRRVEAGGHRNE